MTSNHSSATIDTPSTVISKDGTQIGYLSIGSGPAVIVIPGALSMAADYAAFAHALAEHSLTVYTIERRGRGLSGPQGADYSMAKESEDLLALQKKTGASLLVGHSFGGLVTLEFARNNPALTKIAVYEPGVSINGSINMDWIPDYKKFLAEKQELEAFVAFTLGAGPERARKTPPWLMKLLLPLFMRSHDRQQILSLLPQNLHEHQEVARFDSSYNNYREISASVLLMSGGKSDSKWVELAIERLGAVLPRSETQKFPRLDHFGIDKKAPQEVARAVSAFFLS